jgi:hypothetical protein
MYLGAVELVVPTALPFYTFPFMPVISFAG